MANETTRGIVIGVASAIITALLLFFSNSVYNWVTNAPPLQAHSNSVSILFPYDVGGKDGAGTWKDYHASKNRVLDCSSLLQKPLNLADRIKSDLCKIGFLLDWREILVFELALKNTSNKVIKNVQLRVPAAIGATIGGVRDRFVDIPKDLPIEIGAIQPGEEVYVNAFTLGGGLRKFEYPDIIISHFLLTAEGTKVEISASPNLRTSFDTNAWIFITEYRIFFYILAAIGLFSTVAFFALVTISNNDNLRRRMYGKADYERMKLDVEFLASKFGGSSATQA